MNTENSHMTLALREHIADAICRVVASCQKSINHDIIRNGFKKTGQFPFSFDDKMECCTADIPHNEMRNMRQQFEGMTIKFQNQGYLRESDMDAVGIMKVEDNHKKTKDERAPHRNRALLLNRGENLARFERNKPPEELAPVNRENFKESTKQRNKREKMEQDAAAAQAKAAMKIQQAEKRQQEKAAAKVTKKPRGSYKKKKIASDDMLAEIN
jgi:hypothetical protein